MTGNLSYPRTHAEILDATVSEMLSEKHLKESLKHLEHLGMFVHQLTSRFLKTTAVVKQRRFPVSASIRYKFFLGLSTLSALDLTYS